MATFPPTTGAVRYLLPRNWIAYGREAVMADLVDAKAAVLSLKAIPHQRDWVQKLQEIQLKMEVAGTSRIEGADFTENELDAALNASTAHAQLATRSQRQARAAVETYRWIATIPDDMPITGLDPGSPPPDGHRLR